ncbi:MAG: penicillin-binding protein 2 [Candidatus Niyogibacteria bacterium]|nr:penicillin-binding protein 2 [Candidatus Niyogibacteria bacterium]
MVLVAGGLTLAGAVIVGRLFFIQVVSHSYYTALAGRQHAASADTDVRRGRIYFSSADGTHLPAAGTKSGYLLYIDPRKVADAETLYESLESFLEMPRDEFLSKAAKSSDPFEAIRHRLDEADVEQVKLLGEAAAGIAPEEWRWYPLGALASHVLGFVGFDSDRITGRYGIERSQESILAGATAPDSGLSGVFFDWGRTLFRAPLQSDVILTIEPEAQFAIEKELDTLAEKWKPERAGIIVMDPQTGKILAMSARPNFDPNAYNEAPTLDVFANPLIESVYELGSVFKPLTLSAAMDLGKITPQTTYHDYGYVEIGGERIENFDGKGRGIVSMQQVLSESLNTGAVFAERTIGGLKLRDYFEALGLADRTDIELPGEVLGKLSNLDVGSEFDYAAAAFGQGIAVTPLAFLRAVSALANGGALVSPYIIDRVAVEGGPDRVTEPHIQKNVLKPSTAETMTRMLVRVVDEALLDGALKNEHYSIAAKTGTAQIASPSGGGYSDDYLHAFVGYGPAYDAKFAVFLFMAKPTGERYAARTLSRPFMNIMDFLLSYYRVPPDR